MGGTGAKDRRELEDRMVGCVRTGDLGELRRLAGGELASGQRDEWGRLEWVEWLEGLCVAAAEHGQLEVVRCLVEEGLVRGGRVGANGRGSGALRWAAGSGRLDAVRYLLESPHAQPRCAVGARDSEALRSAAQRGHLEVVKYLGELERRVSPWSARGAISRALKVAGRKGHSEVVEYLRGLETEGWGTRAWTGWRWGVRGSREE